MMYFDRALSWNLCSWSPYLFTGWKSQLYKIFIQCKKFCQCFLSQRYILPLIYWYFTVRHSFQVVNRKDASLQSYVLQANDEQDRQHWLQSLFSAIEASGASAEDNSVLAGSSIGLGSGFSYQDEPFGLDDTSSWAGSLLSLNSVFPSEMDKTEDPLVP